jgi:hypothetical protein
VLPGWRSKLEAAVLRPRRLLITAAAALALMSVAAPVHATMVPVSASVHGTCVFSNVSVSAGGSSFSASGSGTCVVNGVVTTGTLTISGVLTSICPVRSVSGTATLSLGGGYPLQTGSALVAVTGPTATAAFGSLSGLAGEASFTEVILRGVCPAQTSWTGSLTF